jgi:hypothetical protein
MARSAWLRAEEGAAYACAYIAAGPAHHLRLTAQTSSAAASSIPASWAVRLFDEQGVPHSSVTRLPSFGFDVLPFEDPDGIQLELTAPAT